MFRLLMLLVLAFMGGCGRESDQVAKPSGNDLRLATAAELQEGRVVPHSYLVAFRNLLDQDDGIGLSYSMAHRAHLSALAQTWARPSRLRNVRYMSMLNLNSLGLSFVANRTILPAPWLQRAPHEDRRMASLVAVTFASEEEALSSLTQWKDEGRIWFAEPDFKSQPQGELEDTLVSTFDGNADTPWLDQIKFADAIRDIGKLEQKFQPVIAVMDSGVDVLHPDLKDAIFRNETGQNKFCSGDFFGCNTTVGKKETLGDGNVFPTGTTNYGQTCTGANEEGQCEHGTHVAGIIASRNKETYSGICPYCKILIVKVVEIDIQTGRASIADSAILSGLSYISGFKVGGAPQIRIINASFGKYESSRSVELFISALRSSGLGTLMIAAAGNEDTIRRTYPAGFDQVVAVANINNSVQLPTKSKSSNFGMWVDIAAPGDGICSQGGPQAAGIFSSLPGELRGCKAGTSMSAPMVAGVAGLMLTKNPNLSADEIERRLKFTADPSIIYREDLNGAYLPLIGDKLVPLLGSGIVNAAGALAPQDDTTPGLDTGRKNQVQSGCSLLGARAPEARGWSTLLLLSPFLFGLFRLRLKKSSSSHL